MRTNDSNLTLLLLWNLHWLVRWFGLLGLRWLVICWGGFDMKSVIVDGIEYVEKQKPGSRCVIVVDRGWIFAGDVVRENGRIKLDRAIHVFRWESIGFDGMLANPKSSKVTLKAMPHSVDIPEGAEVFCVPVGDQWGL